MIQRTKVFISVHCSGRLKILNHNKYTLNVNIHQCTIIFIQRNVCYDKITKCENDTRNLNWIYQSNQRCAKHNKLNDNNNVLRSVQSAKTPP